MVTPAPDRPARTLPALLCVLVLATMLVFLNLITPGRVWEDDETVLGNPFMYGLRKVPYLFTPEYWIQHDVAKGGAFRPLVQASFAIEHSLWRSDPPGYHLTNVLLHAAAALLCYAWVAQVTGRRRLALVAAALFALHPTRSEAVGWLKNRAEIMCSISMLLALLCFHRWMLPPRRGRRAGWLAGSALLTAAALLCKGLAIVTPLLMMAQAWCLLPRRDRGRGLAATVPVWALVAAYVAFKLVVLSGDVPRRHDAKPVPPQARLMLPGWTAFFYEKLLVLPVRLCADRDTFVPARSHLGQVAAMAAGLALAVAPLVLTFKGRWRGAWALLTCWFLLVLLPYVNVVYIEVRPLADQRAYLPAITFCYLLAWAALRGPARGGAGGALACAALLAFTCLTVGRNFAWHDMHSLFYDAAAKAPYMARVHGNLGTSYHERGCLSQAKRHLVKSVRLDPQPKTCRMLGLTYTKLGETAQGIALLEKAYELKPEPVTCRTLGNAYVKLGQWKQAKRWLEEAVHKRPYSPDAHFALGMCLWRLGDAAGAEREFEVSREQDGTNPEVWCQLGNVHLAAGRANEAAICYTAAVRLEGAHPGAHHNMGLALLAMDREPDAVAAFTHALRLDPTLVEAHVNLAQIYIRRQEWPRAATHLDVAIRLAPRSPVLWRDLAGTLVHLDQLDQATHAYDVACRLDPAGWSTALAAGDLARRRSRCLKALGRYAQALKANPECAAASRGIDAMAAQLATDPGPR